MGFPPEKSSARKKLLSSVKNLPFALCFYISPHKIIKDLADILEILGDRKCSLVREITKIHQEIISMSIKNLLDKISAENIRGELVLIISGTDENSCDDSWQNEAGKLFNDGASVKTIMNLLAAKYDLKNSAVKNYLNSLKSNDSEKF